ncbi:MAG: TolC family protein, partial [Nonlabens sp.]
QAAYEYEQQLLNAYKEVANQVSNLDYLVKSYDLKEQQVQSLTESIEIANQLFQYARADYMEVLLTQRDALEARKELIHTKKEQMIATVDLYKALGGGWR